MNSPDIISICYSAFVTVFFILAGLAIFMQLIMKAFPNKKSADDAPVYSAVASVYSAIYPGTKITKIEEIK